MHDCVHSNARNPQKINHKKGSDYVCCVAKITGYLLIPVSPRSIGWIFLQVAKCVKIDDFDHLEKVLDFGSGTITIYAKSCLLGVFFVGVGFVEKA